MTSLTIAEAVPLGAAFALRLASTHGIRALLIKGAVLQAQGLRGPHESVDVDVWVDPARHADYLLELAALGWCRLDTLSSQDLVAHHATTVRHQLWPITVDVHRHFPGFLADPTHVFDVLWAERSSFSSAGIEVPVPSPPAHAALAALHYLRVPDGALRQDSLPDLVARVREILDPPGLSALSRVVGATGCSEALASFLQDVGAAPASSDTTPHDPAAVAQWNHHQNDVRGALWLRTLAAQPWRRRPAQLWQIAALSAHDIDVLRQPGESRLRARVRRVRTGLRLLPRAAQQVWAQRGGRSA